MREAGGEQHRPDRPAENHRGCQPRRASTNCDARRAHAPEEGKDRDCRTEVEQTGKGDCTNVVDDQFGRRCRCAE